MRIKQKQVSLGVLLVASAVAANAQMAPAKTSGVTFYGRADVSAVAVRYSNENSTRKSVGSNGSMFGFRGTEDLGDGMAAYFKLESGFNADTGAQTNSNQFFNRESIVGFGSNRYGYIELGSHYGPGQWLSARMDPFQRQQMGLNQNILQGPANRGFAATLNNSVEYVTPQLGDFKGRMVAQAGEGAVARGGAVAIDYAANGLYVSAVYDNTSVTGATVGLPTLAFARSKNLSIGSTYLIHPVKLAAFIQQNKVDGLPDVRGFLVGATIYVGKDEIRSSYIRTNNPGAEAYQAAIGYDYFLSKTTQVYTTVARIGNKGKAKFSIFPASADFSTSPLPAGKSENGLEFGLRVLW